MSIKAWMPRTLMMLVLAGVTTVAPLFAGSAVIGSVAGSLNAMVGGQALVPNTVIFSGDSLQVRDGAAVIALENGNRMAFGRETEASFLREGNGVEVVLGRGDVSMYQADNRLGVAVKAGDYEVAPANGYKTLGEVAMLNGLVTVTSKQGTLKVAGAGRTLEVGEGKTVTLGTKVARAPQTGGSQNLGGGSTYLEAGALGAGVVAAILAGVSIKRADDATSAANSANSTAAAAESAANAATSAANSANSAAAAAGAAANEAGCALNTIENMAGNPSPYTPPTGFTCS